MGDRWLLNHILGLAGLSALHQGDLGRAATLYREALQLADQLQDNRSRIYSLVGLSNLFYTQRNLKQAELYIEQGYAVACQTGTPGFIAHFLREKGRLDGQRGNVTTALHAYQQALIWVRALGHHMFVASCLLATALLMKTQECILESTRLLGAAEALYDLNSLTAADDAELQQFIPLIHAQLSDPCFAAAWLEGQQMTEDEAVAYTLTLRAT